MSHPLPAFPQGWPNLEPRFAFGQRVEHVDGAAYHPGVGTVIGYEDSDRALVRWSASSAFEPDVVDVDELIAADPTATTFPHGWTQLIALGPLPRHQHAGCQLCLNPAIVIDLSGPRCADHPPQPGQWGATLNWAPPDTPRPCLPARCYCGRRCTPEANPWRDELAQRRAQKAG